MRRTHVPFEVVPPTTCSLAFIHSRGPLSFSFFTKAISSSTKWFPAMRGYKSSRGTSLVSQRVSSAQVPTGHSSTILPSPYSGAVRILIISSAIVSGVRPTLSSRSMFSCSQKKERSLHKLSCLLTNPEEQEDGKTYSVGSNLSLQ